MHWDVFNSDAFSLRSLTAALMDQDYVPNLIGMLGLFETKNIATETFTVERKADTFAVIQTSERGAPVKQTSNLKRYAFPFSTFRIAKSHTIKASEIQGVRSFGSESELESLQSVWAQETARLMRDVEATWEHMRLGAVQGILLDADGTTLRNYYTDLGEAQPAEIDFELDTATTNVRGKCHGVIRATGRALGAVMPPSAMVHGIAGDEFFDALVDHDTVRQTYLSWSAATELRESKAWQSFPFGGIMFHNYRGSDDQSKIAVPSTECKFFPVGVRDVFEVAFSPGEWFGVVNTRGVPVYNRAEVDPQSPPAWVDTAVYSYPLFLCKRPRCLQRAKLA